MTARAITYYLDVSAECTRRIVAVEGAVKALCSRLVLAEMTSRTSKDLAEQCIKVLEFICTRESGAVFEAGGLGCVLTFINEHGCKVRIHKPYSHSTVTDVTFSHTPQWQCGLSYINYCTIPQLKILIIMHTPYGWFFVYKFFSKLYVLVRRKQSLN